MTAPATVPPFGGPGTARPDFGAPIPDNGYAWWYIDGLSDDGAHGLTIILQLGSVFSPWYAWARQRGMAAAEDHCAVNVALYGRAGKRWAMTERGAEAVSRTPTTLRIGPSTAHWDGTTLTIDIHEITAPLPRRIRGLVRITPDCLGTHIQALDAAGRHRWSPIAPRARIEAEFIAPARSWAGTAYIDMNWGSRALEEDFATWHWCRAPLPDGGAAVLYYVTPREGPRRTTALRYQPDGTATPFIPPPEVLLPTGFWRLPRSIGCEPGDTPRLLENCEDAPFYTRAMVQTRLLGQSVTSFHEAVSLERFDTWWMRMMLPFKAPRAWRQRQT